MNESIWSIFAEVYKGEIGTDPVKGNWNEANCIAWLEGEDEDIDFDLAA